MTRGEFGAACFGASDLNRPFSRRFGSEGLETEKLRWDRRRGGVTDGGLLARACGHHLGLPDCPRRFFRGRRAVLDPYFRRFIWPGPKAPEGACVFGTSWGG